MINTMQESVLEEEKSIKNALALANNTPLDDSDNT